MWTYMMETIFIELIPFNIILYVPVQAYEHDFLSSFDI